MMEELGLQPKAESPASGPAVDRSTIEASGSSPAAEHTSPQQTSTVAADASGVAALAEPVEQPREPDDAAAEAAADAATDAAGDASDSPQKVAWSGQKARLTVGVVRTLFPHLEVPARYQAQCTILHAHGPDGNLVAYSGIALRCHGTSWTLTGAGNLMRDLGVENGGAMGLTRLPDGRLVARRLEAGEQASQPTSPKPKDSSQPQSPGKKAKAGRRSRSDPGNGEGGSGGAGAEPEGEEGAVKEEGSPPQPEVGSLYHELLVFQQAQHRRRVTRQQEIKLEGLDAAAAAAAGLPTVTSPTAASAAAARRPSEQGHGGPKSEPLLSPGRSGGDGLNPDEALVAGVLLSIHGLEIGAPEAAAVLWSMDGGEGAQPPPQGRRGTSGSGAGGLQGGRHAKDAAADLGITFPTSGRRSGHSGGSKPRDRSQPKGAVKPSGAAAASAAAAASGISENSVSLRWQHRTLRIPAAAVRLACPHMPDGVWEPGNTKHPVQLWARMPGVAKLTCYMGATLSLTSTDKRWILNGIGNLMRDMGVPDGGTVRLTRQPGCHVVLTMGAEVPELEEEELQQLREESCMQEECPARRNQRKPQRPQRAGGEAQPVEQGGASDGTDGAMDTSSAEEEGAMADREGTATAADAGSDGVAGAGQGPGGTGVAAEGAGAGAHSSAGGESGSAPSSGQEQQLAVKAEQAPAGSAGPALAEGERSVFVASVERALAVGTARRSRSPAFARATTPLLPPVARDASTSAAAIPAAAAAAGVALPAAATAAAAASNVGGLAPKAEPELRTEEQLPPQLLDGEEEASAGDASNPADGAAAAAGSAGGPGEHAAGGGEDAAGTDTGGTPAHLGEMHSLTWRHRMVYLSTDTVRAFWPHLELAARQQPQAVEVYGCTSPAEEPRQYAGVTLRPRSTYWYLQSAGGLMRDLGVVDGGTVQLMHWHDGSGRVVAVHPQFRSNGGGREQRQQQGQVRRQLKLDQKRERAEQRLQQRERERAARAVLAAEAEMLGGADNGAEGGIGEGGFGDAHGEHVGEVQAAAYADGRLSGAEASRPGAGHAMTAAVAVGPHGRPRRSPKPRNLTAPADMEYPTLPKRPKKPKLPPTVLVAEGFGSLAPPLAPSAAGTRDPTPDTWATTSEQRGDPYGGDVGTGTDDDGGYMPSASGHPRYGSALPESLMGNDGRTASGANSGGGGSVGAGGSPLPDATSVFTARWSKWRLYLHLATAQVLFADIVDRSMTESVPVDVHAAPLGSSQPLQPYTGIVLRCYGRGSAALNGAGSLMRDLGVPEGGSVGLARTADGRLVVARPEQWSRQQRLQRLLAHHEEGSDAEPVGSQLGGAQPSSSQLRSHSQLQQGDEAHDAHQSGGEGASGRQHLPSNAPLPRQRPRKRQNTSGPENSGGGPTTSGGGHHRSGSWDGLYPPPWPRHGSGAGTSSLGARRQGAEAGTSRPGQHATSSRGGSGGYPSRPLHGAASALGGRAAEGVANDSLLRRLLDSQTGRGAPEGQHHRLSNRYDHDGPLRYGGVSGLRSAGCSAGSSPATSLGTPAASGGVFGIPGGLGAAAGGGDVCDSGTSHSMAELEQERAGRLRGSAAQQRSQDTAQARIRPGAEQQEVAQGGGGRMELPSGSGFTAGVVHSAPSHSFAFKPAAVSVRSVGCSSTSHPGAAHLATHTALQHTAVHRLPHPPVRGLQGTQAGAAASGRVPLPSAYVQAGAGQLSGAAGAGAGGSAPGAEGVADALACGEDLGLDAEGEDTYGAEAAVRAGSSDGGPLVHALPHTLLNPGVHESYQPAPAAGIAAAAAFLTAPALPLLPMLPVLPPLAAAAPCAVEAPVGECAGAVPAGGVGVPAPRSSGSSNCGTAASVGCKRPADVAAEASSPAPDGACGESGPVAQEAHVRNVRQRTSSHGGSTEHSRDCAACQSAGCNPSAASTQFGVDLPRSVCPVVAMDGVEPSGASAVLRFGPSAAALPLSLAPTPVVEGLAPTGARAAGGSGGAAEAQGAAPADGAVDAVADPAAFLGVAEAPGAIVPPAAADVAMQDAGAQLRVLPLPQYPALGEASAARAHAPDAGLGAAAQVPLPWVDAVLGQAASEAAPPPPPAPYAVAAAPPACMLGVEAGALAPGPVGAATGACVEPLVAPVPAAEARSAPAAVAPAAAWGLAAVAGAAHEPAGAGMDEQLQAVVGGERGEVQEHRPAPLAAGGLPGMEGLVFGASAD